MISNFDFNSEIAKDSAFVSKIFDYKKLQLIVQAFSSNWMTFDNCTFICDSLTFQNIKADTVIEFRGCKFHCDVFILNIAVERISFTNTKSINFLRLNLTTVNIFEFSNDSLDEVLELSSNFEFTSCKFTNIFQMMNLKHINGRFWIADNKFIQNETLNSYLSFVGSSLNNFYALRNDFAVDAYFSSVNFSISSEVLTNNQETKTNSGFKNNTFLNIDFSNLNIITKLEFLNCKFFGDGLFRDINYSIHNEIGFKNCAFEKNFLIDKSAFYKLSLFNVKFKEISSFQDTFFDKISIENVIFEKQANFDDIQIKQIYECDRRTIRTIKLQLQKAENKIDYNKFRVYEFNAYREDIKKKLNDFKKDEHRFFYRKREPIQLKRDLFVLRVSDVVSEYGTDWKRALKFAIISGFLLFSLFFISENYQYQLNLLCWANWTYFLSGLFRFFLVTDFFNPLVNERIYLTNPLSWSILVFGKIVIAFGIYEMIQSFRKFKS